MTSELHPTLPWPHPRLRNIIERIAELKIQQDYTARTLMGQEFLNDWMASSRGTCAFSPDTFIQRLLPFVFWEEKYDSPKYTASVPVEMAIGACIKGYPEYIKGEDIAKRIAVYRENQPFVGATALGTYIPQLGIYFAHEGKHRVAFMRHHGEPFFQAEVTDLDYPEPHRLKLLKPPASGGFHYAVLDNQFLQTLLCPESTRRILTTYGVDTVRWSDLEGVPSESLVFKAVVDNRLFSAPLNRAEAARTLDLHILMRAEAKETQERLADEEQNSRLRNRAWKLLLSKLG